MVSFYSRLLPFFFPFVLAVTGQDVARMVKSTRNHNATTPIIALASYDRKERIDASGSLFDAVLAKPLEKADVIDILPLIGFTPLSGSNVLAKRLHGSGSTSGGAPETEVDATPTNALVASQALRESVS